MRILVGNGPSIRSIENGGLIDSFDSVVRFNEFVTEGFESYTGVKADVLWTTTLQKYNEPELIGQFKEVVLYLNKEPNDEITEDVLRSPNIISWLDRYYAAMVSMHCGLRLMCWPSTGLAAICFYLSLSETIAITGFDNFKTGYTDYYRDTAPFGGDHHDFNGQEAFVQKMVKAGRIKIL